MMWTGNLIPAMETNQSYSSGQLLVYTNTMSIADFTVFLQLINLIISNS